jgi:hypothetical protein
MDDRTPHQVIYEVLCHWLLDSDPDAAADEIEAALTKARMLRVNNDQATTRQPDPWLTWLHGGPCPG